jgi:hypothetical protein
VNEPALARAWLEAAARDDVAAELEGVYDYIAAAVESRGPACWASGRCCHFEQAGHLLYVTGLETAYALLKAGRDAAQRAEPGGPCPFQEENLCGAHPARPLGCRVYFCDRSAQDWQRDLSERALITVRSLHERHGVEYRYGEWRAMLARFRA